jgi:uncharacterized protein YmfQ (DUF2313 family)
MAYAWDGGIMPVTYTNPLDAVFRINGSKFDDAVDSAILLEREMFPDTALVSLAMYEQAYGIHYKLGAIPDVPTRQTTITTAMRTRGGQSRAYFIALAAAWGYTATITESTSSQFIVDVSSPPATQLPAQLYGPEDQFAWVMDYVSTTNDYLFEDYINERKAAHTRVTFTIS